MCSANMKGLYEDVFVSFMFFRIFLCLYMIIMLKRQDSGHIEFTRAGFVFIFMFMFFLFAVCICMKSDCECNISES